MSYKFFKAAALSTALLLSTTSLYAAEVSVGGISANVGGGGVSVRAHAKITGRC